MTIIPEPTTWQPSAPLLAAIRDRSVWEAPGFFAAWVAELRAHLWTTDVPIRVLDLLAAAPDQWFTSRQIAEALGVPFARVGAFSVYTQASKAVLGVVTADAYWPIEIGESSGGRLTRYRMSERIAALWHGAAGA